MSSRPSHLVPTYASLGRLGQVTNEELCQEAPLFAAERHFAREFGGPLTRRFLDALPADWQAAPLVIDSFLVGLAARFDPGPQQFHREPCPEQSGGAWDLANQEREVEHVHAVFGPSLPQLVTGPLDELALPQVSDWRDDLVAARDRAIRARIDSGENGLETPAEGELIRYGDSTFLRWPAAERWGFHFWIRATRGSRRPLVNGLRNHAQM